MPLQCAMLCYAMLDALAPSKIFAELDDALPCRASYTATSSPTTCSSLRRATSRQQTLGSHAWELSIALTTCHQTSPCCKPPTYPCSIAINQIVLWLSNSYAISYHPCNAPGVAYA